MADEEKQNQWETALYGKNGNGMQIHLFRDDEKPAARATLKPVRATRGYGGITRQVGDRGQPTVISVGPFEPKATRKYKSIVIVDTVDALLVKVGIQLSPLVTNDASYERSEAILEKGRSFFKGFPSKISNWTKSE